MSADGTICCRDDGWCSLFNVALRSERLYGLLGVGSPGSPYLLSHSSWAVMPDKTTRSCQPLLGVNLSPEFVNLYFPYADWGLLLFRWWQRHFEFQLAHVAVEGRSNVVLNIHAWLQISLPVRLLSLCTRPVSVHLAMACVGCLFDSFSVFLLSLKQNKISWKLCFPVSIFQYGHIPPK